MKKVQIKVDDQSISGTLVFPEDLKEKNPSLLWVHGWNSNQSGNILRANELAKLGFVSLTIDLRGHGESSGKLEDFSREDHLKDLKASFDFLISQIEVDQKRVGVIGASYGGYLSSILTLERDFNWLVMRAPALYYDDDFYLQTAKLIKEKEEAFKSSDLTPDNAKPLNGVCEFPGDILLVESGQDKVIPHSTIENYLEFIPKEKLTYKLMKTAEHHLGTEEEQKEYIEILVDWFNSKLTTNN